MKVIRKYYDQSKAEADAIMRKCCEGKACKTLEEAANDKMKMKKEIETFIKDVKESEQNTCFVLNEQKQAEFDMMCKCALLVAKYAELNIEIDTDDKNYSTIEFTMERLFLTEDVPKEIGAMIWMLHERAKETWVDTKEGFISLMFFFRVNDKISKPAGDSV